MRETVGDNLDIEIPLTNCKVLYQDKKNRTSNVLCVLSFHGCGWQTSSQEEGTVLPPVVT